MFHFTFDSNQVKNILSPRYFILHTISSTDIDILKTYSLEVKFTSQMEACCWRNSHGDDWFQQPCLFLFKTKLDLLFRLGRIFYKNPFSIVDRKHSIIQVFFLCLRCRVVHGRFLKTHSLEIIIVRKKYVADVTTMTGIGTVNLIVHNWNSSWNGKVGKVLLHHRPTSLFPTILRFLNWAPQNVNLSLMKQPWLVLDPWLLFFKIIEYCLLKSICFAL